jgi:hypothetical protein
VRPLPEEEEIYTGVSAPRRKKVDDQPIITEMPKVRSDCPSFHFLLSCSFFGGRGKGGRSTLKRQVLAFERASDACTFVGLSHRSAKQSFMSAKLMLVKRRHGARGALERAFLRLCMRCYC